MVLALWGAMPGLVWAQQSGSSVPTSNEAPPGGDTADLEPETRSTPSSTETGQSPLDESFVRRNHADWVRETRRKAWQDTEFNVQIRSYYLDRDRYDDSESEAWALGGSAGLKTGYFRERFALGATGYTSQRLHGPDDKDGTLLLKPGQHGYTVLGELYGEFLLDQDTRLSIGRRGFDTPYLNRSDSRMAPNTFEAIALQGLYGGGEGESEWRMGGGYFDEIKQRNADEFVSMATVAGAANGVERGVYVGGANYSRGGFSIGAIDYYSDDILNIFYAETKYALPLGDSLRLQFALQYSDQRSTGDDLLTAAEFSSQAVGRQGRTRRRRCAVLGGVYQRRRRQRHAKSVGRLSRLHRRAGRRLRTRRRTGLDAARRLQLPVDEGLERCTPYGSMARIRRIPGSTPRTNTTSTCSGHPAAAR